MKNPVEVRPDQLRPGDVMAVVVTVHIGESGARLYRCSYPPDTFEGVPQGTRLPAELEDAVLDALFPVVGWANIEVDLL